MAVSAPADFEEGFARAVAEGEPAFRVIAVSKPDIQFVRIGIKLSDRNWPEAAISLALISAVPIAALGQKRPFNYCRLLVRGLLCVPVFMCSCAQTRHQKLLHPWLD